MITRVRQPLAAPARQSSPPRLGFPAVAGGSEPFYYQPYPARPYYVQPKGGKLIRRGPCDFSITWTKPNGEAVESPLDCPPDIAKLS
jgi:hypothetical protein